MNHPKPISIPSKADLRSTIFHEPWWLDIVTGRTHDRVQVKRDGQVVGWMPYCPRRRMGLSAHLMPPLTHFLGPVVAEGEGNIDTRFITRLGILRELIQQLPKADLINIKCHRGVTDTIAFQENDFATSVQFTFEIFPQSIDTVWKNMRSPRRTVIRGAQREGITVENYGDADAFADFYWRNLDERGAKPRFSKTLCRDLIDAATARNRGRVLFANDRHGEHVAAIFYVWDLEAAYYLMTTRTQQSHNGAISLLVWEAIKNTMQMNLVFDLDGLHHEGAIMFLAGFGAQVSPRYILTRGNLFLRTGWEIKTRGLRGKHFC
ncbi:GNAT family N-acetyltransferase [Methylobacterium soli]|uniref:GNAT family N-acetyltransferase n=1 Tax=Methylobacterium soli TaxID=553447 RepID=A0A6L3SW37_9HYPH|nr:GNAT family N-acetyltransferase [Methylobacterium soli]KAB1078008.1 GNAT family N-acetyltransferase [Methylobacterium soli]GJE44957.1 hypothetical protein AEGHOMDF_4151 [Methylobacterium soli]